MVLRSTNGSTLLPRSHHGPCSLTVVCAWQVADPAALNDSTQSLQVMLSNFFKRTHPEWSAADVQRHVAALDMVPVSQL